MDYGILTDLISSVGFPIVCCVYMMVNNNKTLKQLTEAVNTLTVTVKTLHGVEQAHIEDHHEEGLSYVKGDVV